MQVAEMPGAIRKPWGWTVDLMTEPTLQISMLDIEAGGECSRHFHRDKKNRFYVRSGVLLVRWWIREGLPAGMVRLEPGNWIELPANLVHQFFAPEPCRVLEIYTPAREGEVVDPGDIVRLDQSAVA